MLRLKEYKNKTAIITGASSGIGKSLALSLAAKGTQVVLVARREELLKTLQAEITQAGGKASSYTCDVADKVAVFETAANIMQKHGSIDLLINSAGFGGHQYFADCTLEDAERTMQVNYFGSIYWTKALLPLMTKQQRGWIVYISSVAGRMGIPDETIYSASKFAISGFAEALSIEVEEQGIQVLSVHPGPVRTEFYSEHAWNRLSPKAKKIILEPEYVAAQTLSALEKGKLEITLPKHVNLAYIIKAIAPRFLRGQIRKTALAALN